MYLQMKAKPSISPEAYSKASLVLLLSIILLQFCIAYLDFTFSVV